jgi:hypothetical protein
MKWCAFALGILALVLIAVSMFQPQNERDASSGEKVSSASPSTLLGIPTMSRNRQVGDQKKISQQELAQQFIVEADRIIAEKRISFQWFAVYDLFPDNLEKVAKQMDRQTVLRLLEHYGQWDKDIYQCGVACHLLSRLSQLTPEEALSLYDQKIGLSKVTEILKLSDEKEEEDIEKNPKAIPTMSFMAVASGYQVGKPGSKKLFIAFMEVIPWKEINRVMEENDESIVGESGMLCMMIFCGMLAEECKLQPEYALAELNSLPISNVMKVSILGSLVDNDEIPFRHLQDDVESHINRSGNASDEQQQLTLSFAKRIFAESPDDAAQWLAQHKLPLEDRSASELDSLLVSWTPDTHAAYLAWSIQLDDKLRSRITAQKMEQLCVSLANSMSPQSELSRDYEMLDSLRPHVSSPQLLLIIKKIPPLTIADDEADDNKPFRELLQHLKFPEAEIQKLLEEKSKSE